MLEDLRLPASQLMRLNCLGLANTAWALAHTAIWDNLWSDDLGEPHIGNKVDDRAHARH